MRRCDEACRGVSRRVKACRGVSRCFEVFRGISTCVEVCLGVSKRIEAHVHGNVGGGGGQVFSTRGGSRIPTTPHGASAAAGGPGRPDAQGAAPCRTHASARKRAPKVANGLLKCAATHRELEPELRWPTWRPVCGGRRVLGDSRSDRPHHAGGRAGVEDGPGVSRGSPKKLAGIGPTPPGSLQGHRRH